MISALGFFPPLSGILFHFDNVVTLLRNSLTLLNKAIDLSLRLSPVLNP